MKLHLAFATACATLLFSCSPNQEANPVSNTSSKHPVTIQASVSFSLHYYGFGIRCTQAGTNCMNLFEAVPAHLVADFDDVIANGPSAIGTYFSTVNGDWNAVFPGIDTSEPTVYANLAAGNYSITKAVSGTDSYYYIGIPIAATPSSPAIPVGPSNYIYVVIL